MRKIDKLLTLAVVPPFLISLSVLTFVVFMNELGHLSELLITKNASPGSILIIAGTVAPGILIFSLPLSLLIGTLIGLSGLSGECQITALRACGVPLRRMLGPVLFLAAVVGLATGILSVVVLPKTNTILENLKNLINVRQATSQIVPRVFNEDFSRGGAGVVFYLDDLSTDRQHWDRVFLADNSDPRAPRIILARDGTWVTDRSGRQLQLHLENGTIYEVNKQDPSKDNISLFKATDLSISLDYGSGAEDARLIPKKPAAQSMRELWDGRPGMDATQRREQLFEFHQRLALPCSVIGFALIGLTLGVSTRRGGRTAGSVLSLVLVLLFYVLFFDGKRLASVGKLPPWLGAWGADIILLAIGIFLLVDAEQKNYITQWAANWRWKPRLKSLVSRWHMEPLGGALQKIDDLAYTSTRKIARFRYPKVLDSYISRGFLAHFIWSIAICYALFVLLTLFDLLDEIIRNRIPGFMVLQYFTFLTPQILLLIVPMAVLLAILIQFGILEKGSEITALKAGGWSLYRIALPVLLISCLICVNMYLMQDYVLPYANARQDILRNLIKKRPQTSMQMRKWIIGKSDRIFNYDYFDSSKNVFLDLNVYEVDLQRLTINRRIYAKQAAVHENSGWTLENGWVRDFRRTGKGFKLVTNEVFTFPEKPSYFKKEIFDPRESSKFTYFKLKEYIEYLKESGYNATELEVELNNKLSFPLSCFVMALLGVPFSFSMGKKGAFFGITASVAIAMSYWGVFRIFEQMGAYGMLAPLLAAWAPNLLFGAAGLALLFTIRT